MRTTSHTPSAFEQAVLRRKNTDLPTIICYLELSNLHTHFCTSTLQQTLGMDGSGFYVHIPELHETVDFRARRRVIGNLFKILILTDHVNGTAQQTAGVDTKQYGNDEGGLFH